jgi:transposase
VEVDIDKLELRVFTAGPAALVARMCDILRIPQIIDSVVEWDPKNCRLSPGLRAKAMIINILVDRRALYDVEKFYQTQDLEVLFGPEAGVMADELNDDALGRALDKIYACDLERLFSMIALNAAALHDVPLTELFSDTTSISVAGAYEGGHGDLFITYGYSKDERPDLKQFLIGLVVNQEGLPVFAQALDGNQSDKTWYPQVVKKLEKVFSPESLKKTIFVADCALVTVDNLDLFAQKELKFISRLPHTFAAADLAKEKAYQEGEWVEAGVLSERKGAASYRLKEYLWEIGGRPYRLIVVHSSALDEKKEKTLKKSWEKQRAELEQQAKELARRPFACRADAEKAIAIFERKHQAKPFTFQGQVREEVSTTYARPGRPKKLDVPTKTVTYFAEILIQEDEEAQAREKAKAATFVLITNLMDAKDYPAVKILKEYKQGNSVEGRFRFLKNPFLLGPVFLKTERRVEAMAFIFQLALLVAAYFEYRVRQSLKNEDRPLVLWKNRKTNKPAITALLDMLEDLAVAKIGPNRYLVNHHGPEVIRTLELAGFGKEIYLKPSCTGG